MSYKDFYEKYTTKGLKSEVKWLSIACYIVAALLLVMSWFINFAAVFSAIFYLVFGILIHVNKKWGLTLTVTIISVVSMLLSFATGGGAGALDIFILLASYVATRGLKQLSDAYKEYQLSGTVPAVPVDVSWFGSKKK